MFYRVRENDRMLSTFVFDNPEPARGVYDVLIRADLTSKVDFETVLDDGTVVYSETRAASDDPVELAYREYCFKNGYNEHGFKVGSF